MLKNTSLTLQGNNKFYGFCIDILKEIASQLGLTYTIYVVPDGSYGRYNPITGKWTGIVGEMVEKVI